MPLAGPGWLAVRRRGRQTRRKGSDKTLNPATTTAAKHGKARHKAAVAHVAKHHGKAKAATPAAKRHHGKAASKTPAKARGLNHAKHGMEPASAPH